MLERGKMDRWVPKISDTKRLVLEDHLLHQVDAAVDFNKMYKIAEQVLLQELSNA